MKPHSPDTRKGVTDDLVKEGRSRHTQKTQRTRTAQTVCGHTNDEMVKKNKIPRHVKRKKDEGKD